MSGGLRKTTLRRFFDEVCPLTSLNALLIVLTYAPPSFGAMPPTLPFGAYPRLESVVETDPNAGQTLESEISGLQERALGTVKTFAAHRNFTCFGSPCQVQFFPLAYTNYSGFFAGGRLNVTQAAYSFVPSYRLEAQAVRSDTQQWNAQTELDFPKVNFLPTIPRIRGRGQYSRTTTKKFFGIGDVSKATIKRDRDELRYSMEGFGLQGLVVLPIYSWEGRQQFSTFLTAESIGFSLKPFDAIKPSKLYEDNPFGADGGISGNLGIGFLIDSRDEERLPKKGWALEASVKFAGRPIGSFFFQRYTLIDRRYFTWRTLTFSSRITLDSVGNDAPFWELAGVGGYDPVLDINGSHILKGVDSGRYHEYHKAIGNFEIRWPLRSRRVIGLLIEPILVPIGADVGRMGSQNAYSINTGFYAFFNKGILARGYACFGEPGFAFTLGFGTDL